MSARVALARLAEAAAARPRLAVHRASTTRVDLYDRARHVTIETERPIDGSCDLRVTHTHAGRTDVLEIPRLLDRAGGLDAPGELLDAVVAAVGVRSAPSTRRTTESVVRALRLAALVVGTAGRDRPVLIAAHAATAITGTSLRTVSALDPGMDPVLRVLEVLVPEDRRTRLSLFPIFGRTRHWLAAGLHKHHRVAPVRDPVERMRAVASVLAEADDPDALRSVMNGIGL